MWGFKLFVIFFNFNVVFLPVFVDLGVQIWNGVSISQTDFTERTAIWDIGYETGTDEIGSGEDGGTRIKRQVQDEQKCEGENCDGELIEGSGTSTTEDPSPSPKPIIHILPKPHLLTLHISENFVLRVNKESIISLALLQLPAVFLAIYGIVHACYQPTIGAKLTNSLSAFLLIFIPFSLIEFFTLLEVEFAHRGVRFLLEKLKQLFGFCCSGCSDKTSLDLLYFFPNKDPTCLDRAHSVSICKIIFGSCLQLCFQTVLLSGYTKTEDFPISQFLSILCSAFIITKTAVSIVTYRRETVTRDEDESSTAGQTLKSFLSAQMSLFKQFLLALPLLLSSLIFQSGTLILAILIFGYFSAIYIMTVLFLHLVLSILFPYPAAQKMEKKLGLTFKFPQPNPENDLQKITKHKIIRGFFNSWANVFVFLRPVEELTYYNIVHVGLLQPLRFIVNVITIIAMISCTWVPSTPYDPNLKIYLTVSLAIALVAGILNELEMLCYFYFGKLFFLSKPPKEDPEKNVEMKEIQNNVGEKNGLHDTLKYIDADRISEDMPLLYQNEEEKKGEEKDVKKEEATGNVSAANDPESPNQTISPDETTSLNQTMSPNKTISPNETLSAATFPESEKKIEKKADSSSSSSSESDEDKTEEKTESILSESDKNKTVNKSSISISSISSESDHEETAETSVLETSKANNDETEKNSDTSDTDNEDTNKDTTESPPLSPIPPRIPLMSNISIISTRSVDGSCFIPEDAFEIVEPSQEMTKEDVKQTFNNIQEQGGKVGKEEFINTMMKLFPRYNMEENRKKLAKLFDRLDKNNDGLITFRQFMLVTIAFSNIPLEGKLIKIFQLIDENRDDELTYDEFADVVRDILVLKEERKISSSLVEERFSKNTFRDMGMDDEGKVNLRGFVEACTRHKFIFINYVENFKDGFLVNQNISIS